MKSRIATYLFSSLILISCGGGGGGGDKAPADVCGNIHLKIVGGEKCSPDNSSVVAFILLDAATNVIGVCSATLITPTTVLTAAHCIVEPTAKKFAIIANNTAFPVSKVKVHPNYQDTESKNPGFDIAVATLSSPVDLPPIPLVLSRGVEKGDSLGVYGYGQDENDQGFENFGTKALKGAFVTVTDFSGDLTLTEYNDTRTGSCEGDSGGPLMLDVDGTSGIVGVVKGGGNLKDPTSTSCLAGTFDAFTNTQLPSIASFILENAPGAKTI